jgi:hypothetical protein
LQSSLGFCLLHRLTVIGNWRKGFVTCSRSSNQQISNQPVYTLFAWLISHQPTIFFSQNKPAAAISQQYFSLRTNQHQPSATSQTNRPSFSNIHQLPVTSIFYPLIQSIKYRLMTKTYSTTPIDFTFVAPVFYPEHRMPLMSRRCVLNFVFTLTVKTTTFFFKKTISYLSELELLLT